MTLMMGLTIHDRQVRLRASFDASVPTVRESVVVRGLRAAAALRAGSVAVRLRCRSGEGAFTSAPYPYPRFCIVCSVMLDAQSHRSLTVCLCDQVG